MWDLNSSTRDWTPCNARWSLNCWTAREVPQSIDFNREKPSVLKLDIIYQIEPLVYRASSVLRSLVYWEPILCKGLVGFKLKIEI